MTNANNFSKKERVAVFIDGFNLYFGMKSSCPNMKWLNVYLLCQNVLKAQQTLIQVNYFTARIGNDPQKEKRQSTYLAAIKTTPTNIIYGHYKSKPKSCKSCGHPWIAHEEKMTDVNIAMEMFKGAYQDDYDLAILISGDSDLVPPIQSVQSLFNKKVFVLFPPVRHNRSVASIANGSMILGRGTLSKAQFPNAIQLPNHTLTKPSIW